MGAFTGTERNGACFNVGGGYVTAKGVGRGTCDV
jgi:hypothetical protein